MAAITRGNTLAAPAASGRGVAEGVARHQQAVLTLQPRMGESGRARTATGQSSVIQYLMQAADSVTGALYYWLRPEPDFAGAYYNTPVIAGGAGGPNSPTQIAVSINRK